METKEDILSGLFLEKKMSISIDLKPNTAYIVTDLFPQLAFSYA